MKFDCRFDSLHKKIKPIKVIQTYAMAAEVFGQDEKTSGFCFGIMGIVEKFTNGGVVIAIQGLSEQLIGSTVTEGDFYRFVFRYGVVGFSALCVVGAIGLKAATHHRPIKNNSFKDSANARGQEDSSSP